MSTVKTFRDENGSALYHVVYLQPTGFVILAADDLVEPIVAFSSGSQFDPSASNPLGALVSRDLPRRVSRARRVGRRGGRSATQSAAGRAKGKWQRLWAMADTPATADAPPAGATGTVSDERVPPLVATRWSQGSAAGGYCYNYYTPSHYVCGCVATAMAQVMRYWEFPAAGVGTPSFTISVDGVPEARSLRGGDGSGSPYAWAQMPLIPSAGLTETQRQAIGTLCHDAGVAVNMSYASGGSGAYISTAARELVDTFGYSNAIFAWNNNQQILGTALTDMVNTNLDAGRPVIMGVYGDGGHAIVCDGYGYDQASLYHHLNLGWAGADDAWYNLPNVDTTYYIFDSLEQIVYNIYRTGSGEIISGRVTDTIGEPIEGVAITAQRSGGGVYEAVTNSRGIYAIEKVPSASSYTLTAAKTGLAFLSQAVSTGTSADDQGTSGNVWGVDFVGANGPEARILTVESSPVPDVPITGTHAGTTNYAAILEHGDAVSLIASDVTAVGESYYRFARWTLDGADQPAGEHTLTFNITDHVTAVAVYAPVPDLQVATTSLPAGARGAAYSATVAATGGITPYAWSVVPGEQLTAQHTPAGGTAQSWRGDDNSWLYTLPFAFPFCGSTYTSVYVCSNGYLDFASSYADYSNTTTELLGNVRIAPVWDDLKTDGNAQPGEDIYIHQPDAHSVAIRWVGETYWNSAPVNVEVLLTDTGEIRFHYGSDNTSLTPTVGISAGDGVRYVVSAHDGASALTAAQTARFTPLHPGLSLDAATGAITGAPQVAETRACRFVVEDAAGASAYGDLSLEVADPPTITVTDCPTEVAPGETVSVAWTISGGTPSAHNHLHWRTLGDPWQGSQYSIAEPYGSSFAAPDESCTLEVVVHAVIGGVGYYSEVHQILVAAPAAQLSITVTDCPTEVTARTRVEVAWEIAGGTPSAHNHLHWRKAGEPWQGSAYCAAAPYSSGFTAPAENCTVELLVHAIIDGESHHSGVHQVTVTAPPAVTVTACPTEVPAGALVEVAWTVTGATPSAHNHLHWRRTGESWQGSPYTSTPPYSSTFTAPADSCTVEVMVHTVIDGRSYYSDVRQITVTSPPSITVLDCPTDVDAGGQVTVTWEITGGAPSAHNHLHWRKAGEAWQGSPYTTTPPYSSTFSAPPVGCVVEVVVHAIIDGQSYYSDVHEITVVEGLFLTTAPPCLDILSGRDIDFGAVAVGGVAAIDPALRIFNAGGGTLKVTVSTEAPFHVVPDGGPPASQHSFCLAAGEEGTVGLEFAPFGEGAFAETIYVSSNGGSRTCTARGTGTQ